jgi:THO complex subunit 2
MHVYNAVLVMKEIITVFPLADVTTVGPEIFAVVEKLAETETRSDLKMLATAYAHTLKKREPFWAGAKAPSKVRSQEHILVRELIG